MSKGQRRAQEGRADSPAPRHRFYVPDLAEAAASLLTGETAHRIVRVLRLSPGAGIQLFDGRGSSRSATVLAVDARRVHLALGPIAERQPEPATLLLAGLMRPNRFEWLVEKATELGATAIQPLIAERSVVRPAKIGAARIQRWRRIAIEAAEQSGRVTVPAVLQPAPFASALDALETALFVAAEPAHGATPSLGSLLMGIGGEPVAILTGPEGGLTDSELRSALAVGGRAVSLGPLTLRAETAALAALSVLADARQGAAGGGAPELSLC